MYLCSAEKKYVFIFFMRNNLQYRYMRRIIAISYVLNCNNNKNK